MRFKTTTYFLVMAVIALLATPEVFAQHTGKPQPSFTVFDVPGTDIQTWPTAINLGGTTTGLAYDMNAGIYHGFVRTPGGHITTFDAPGAGTVPGSFTLGFAINQVGEVTGQFGGPENVSHGFIRKPGGKFVTFDAPGAGTDGGQGTIAAAINLFGQVGGWYADSGYVLHGFLRAADGTFTTFDAPGAGTDLYQGTLMENMSSITLDGSLTGWYYDASGVIHGWLRKGDGTITTFDVPGSEATYPVVINERGEIGGTYVDAAGVFHSFLRAPDGNFTTVDPGSANSEFLMLNSSGAAAGPFYDADNDTIHGFLRAADGTITTFDAPGAIGPDGTQPFGMNDLGAITGYFTDANGMHGFVRSPHP